jgi:large subunit ribosomal protein L24
MKSKYHVKKNDAIYVISGKWRGEKGKIIAVIKEKDRVVLELPNLSPEKQHEIGRKTIKKSQDNPKGGLIERTISVHVSNVAKIKDEKSK